MVYTYGCSFKTTGAKRGHVDFTDSPGFDVATPLEFNGPGACVSPESLLAASLLSCLCSTLWTIMDGMHLDTSGIGGRIEMSLDKAQGRPGYEFDRAEVVITAPEGMDLERLKKAVELAHGYCFVSRAMEGNLAVNIEIETVK